MVNIYFAVPTHSNTLSVETARSLLDFSLMAPAHGVQVRFFFHSASMISHLRNTIIADFLAGDFTHVFMLDSDQGIENQVLFRMLQSGYPVVGTLYPRRNFSWNQFDPQRPVTSIDGVLNQAMRFVGNIQPDAQGQIQIKNGFAKASNVGTGTLLIKREVILKLMSKYPELKGQGFPDEDENVARREFNWGFFNPLVKSIDGRNAGEDVGFCHRWSGCGGEIWAEITTDMTHVGQFKFKGNYISHLKATGAIP